MTLTEASARLIADQFRHEEPDDCYKQSRTVSRRQLVRSLYDAIMEKRKAGFSFEGIAEHLGRLGAPMTASTLQSYLLDARRKTRTDEAPSSGNDAKAHGAPHPKKKRERKRQTRPAARGADGSREKMQVAAANVDTTMHAAVPDASSDAPTVAEHDPASTKPQGDPDGKRNLPPMVAAPGPDAPRDNSTDWVQQAATEVSVKKNGESVTRRDTPAAHAPAMNAPSFGFVPRNR